MKPLYTQNEYDNAKSMDRLPCKCYQCNNVFYPLKKHIEYEIKHNEGKIRNCSQLCNGITFSNKKIVKCSNCRIEFQKKLSQIKKSNNHFCTRTCGIIYNNKNKIHGTRRSKLEVYIEEQLTQLYPDLDIHFNRKDTIGSELDIYIPSLNVAFELNGIFHYEPIYGVDKFGKIQENDKSKSKACIDHKIDLCIIDTSQQKYFKPKTSQKYLDIMTNIIDERLLIS